MTRSLLALCTGAFALVAASSAHAAPVIDGNMDDMITYAQSLQSSHTGTGLVITDQPNVNGDPTPETIYNDLKFIPCPTPQPALGQHWVNGTEIFRHVLAYEPGSTKLYLGIRSEGFIGDSDGNNNPDTSGGGTCNPNDNIKDSIGISGNELYSWSFDLNCDGVADGTLRLQDNALVGAGTLSGATGTFAFRQGGSASGHDLEVEVNLPAPLPASFNYLRVESNAFDGLSEDRSDGAPAVGTPGIAVQKTATPTAICPGQTTRFTVTVQNTGTTPLSVVVVDQLPSALSYAANLSSSCGVGAPNVNGQTLTFPAFNLAAGTNCTISFDAQASAQCQGSQNNVVDATGTFTSACLPEGGGKVVLTAHAEFAVTCKAPPCVELTANPNPASACPGDPVTISGTVKNCSTESETVVVTVGGVQAFSQVVAAGGTANWSHQTTMPQCTAGQQVAFAVEAIGSNDCNPAGDHKTTTVNILCKQPPCVDLVDVHADKASACPGAPIHLSGTVKNCGTDSANYTVTVGGVQVFSGSLAAGATSAFSRDVNMSECTAGSSVTWSVAATASNSCGNANKSTEVSVLCKAPPCVELTANPNPTSACPGDAITISGTVKNCSPESETITVTVGGVQAFSQVVAAGATANWSRQTTMPQCTAGQSSSFAIDAVASNDCNPAGVHQTTTVSVQCKNPPCVQLTDVQASTLAACPGEPVTVSGNVKNCGADSATYTVTIGGVQVFSGSLAAGASQAFNRQVSMAECTGGASVTWTVHATASNSCGNANDEKTASVTCRQKPCVELTATGPNAACTGTPITLSGTVRNCSNASETITVTVDGVQAFSGSVAAGGQSSWTLQTQMKTCTAGGNATYAVVASSTNGCGSDQKSATVTVTCNAPPCVAIDLNAPALACAGTTIQLCGSVTNCSPGVEAIEVTYNGQTQRFDGVQPGQSRTYCFDARMENCTTGDVRTFTVTAAGISDCGRSERSVTDETKCKLPMLKVKKAGESTVEDGGTIHYTIIVENPGDVDLQNVFIRDTLCRTTVYNNNANPPTYTAPNVGQNGVVVWKVDLLKAQESRAFTFEAKASLVAGGYSGCPTPGTCINAVDAEGSCAGSDGSSTIKAHDDLVTTINCGGGQACDGRLAVETTVSPTGAVDRGATLRYTIRVTNPGTGTVDNVVATDNLCGNATYQGNASPAPTTAPGTGTTGNVVWNLGPLEAGGVRTLSFDARIKSDLTCGSSPLSCTNNASVTGSCDGSSVDAHASATSSINCAQTSCDPKVRVEKWVSPSESVTPGTTLHYTIKVTNPGSSALENVKVTDTLCDDVTYQGNASPSPNTAPSVGSTGYVVWNLGALEAGGNRTVTFDAKVRQDLRCDGHDGDDDDDDDDLKGGGAALDWGDDDDHPSERTCTGWVKAVGSCGGIKAESQASVTTKIQCATTESCKVKVEAGVSPSGDIDAGATLHYTIKVKNPGSTPLDNVQVKNAMCDGATYQGNASPSPSSAPGKGESGYVVWNVGTIEPGGERTLSFDAQAKNCSRHHDGDDDDDDDDFTANGDDGDDDDRSCSNTVKAWGYCGSVKAESYASVKTDVRCSKDDDDDDDGDGHGTCHVSGSGSRNEDGDHRSTFGIASGSWDHSDRNGDRVVFNWHSGNARVTDWSRVSPGTCSTTPLNLRANIAGTGKYAIGSSGNQDGNMVAVIIDHEDGSCGRGTHDEYSIVVRKGLAVGSGEIVYQSSGYIDSGDLKVVTGSTGSSGTPAADANVVQPGRPYPNPFSGTTNFAFQVAEGGQTVDVGVYNVAGRLVKTLAQGAQGASTHIVTWDGTDAGGIRMAPGVYFLKSRVGNDQTVNRLIYVSR